ncbi:RNA repair domain-containing protein [Spirillospora sp. NBC_01491]|uniref:RNA repair domain-containing protein n=1 Tax=Spirillospora sp. NBC_01491 TaxID=2976007 RepID=UPI002E364933|nr:RNA repair domain-containing protein [Spirillospora sp. NBC_01491]
MGAQATRPAGAGNVFARPRGDVRGSGGQIRVWHGSGGLVGRGRTESHGLRPVQDVIARIRFDGLLDAAGFSVGYEDRFNGERESALTAFAASGDLPWHRVAYIKAGDLVVWDRRTQTDLIFGTGNGPGADLDAVVRACAAAARPAEAPLRAKASPRAGASHPAPVSLPCSRFDAATGRWTPAPGGIADVIADALHVVTYNVLADVYETHRTYGERRIGACVDLLGGLGADVVALHEATPRLREALLAAPWVRAGFHVSAAPDPAVPYGEMLLSRWPLLIERHDFSRHKHMLLGRVVLNGRVAAFASAHLTSDRTRDAGARRAEQLRVLGERLAGGGISDAVVLADVNFGDGAEDALLREAGLTDAWREVHPHDPGFTFDPGVNPLAALMSATGRPRRLDRILVRSDRMTPVEVSRFGDRALEDVPPPGEGPRYASDHFGVSGLVEVGAPAGRAGPVPCPEPAVNTSALAVLPPEGACGGVQAVRAAHDPAYRRWMPHLNLFFGFVGEEHFGAAADVVAEAVAGLGAFRVRAAELRRFDHRSGTTVWAEPVCDPPGALEDLRARLAPYFPGCAAKEGRAFTPHLTVARLEGRATAARIAELRALMGPVEFTVDAVHLISRRGDEPFASRRTVPLAAGGPSGTPPWPPPPSARTPSWSRLPSARHAAALAAFAEACAGVPARPRLHVHLAGSSRLGVAAPDADLDLVCAGPDGREPAEVLAAVGERLAASARVRTRQVEGPGGRVLRCRFDGVDVDLQYAGIPARPDLPLPQDLPELTAHASAALDEDSRRAALGVTDSDALVRSVAGHADIGTYQELLRRVRRWARARRLDKGSWGLLGGHTWAILAAYALRDAVEHRVEDAAGRSAPRTGDALLHHFFDVFGRWPAGRPVTVGPPPTREDPRTVWAIYSPTPPPFNTARGLTRSTLQVLRDELRRGARELSGGRPDALCEPPDPGVHQRRLLLDLRCAGEPGEGEGWLDGRMLNLVRALEGEGAAVRPYPDPGPIAEGDGRRFVIGLDGGTAGALAAVARSFADRPEQDAPSGTALTARLTD